MSRRPTQVIVKIITIEAQQQPNNHHNPTHFDHTISSSTSSTTTGVAINNNNKNTSSVIAISPPQSKMVGSMIPNQSSLFKSHSTFDQDPNPNANASSIGSTPTTTTGTLGRQRPHQQSPPPQQHEDEAQQTVAGSVSELKRLLSASAASKPAPNYGKPNLAPKPPGNQLTPGTPANGSTPTSPLLQGGGGGVGAVKATVARHHSMRTPR